MHRAASITAPALSPQNQNGEAGTSPFRMSVNAAVTLEASKAARTAKAVCLLLLTCYVRWSHPPSVT